MAPTYEEIAAWLLDGFGPPGSVLPSESQVVTRYGSGIGRAAVRHAYDLLEAGGRVYTAQGRRRVVRDVRRWRYDMNTLEQRHGNGVDAWTAAMLEQGADNPETDVDAHTVRTDPYVAELLDVEEGRRIISRRRTHSIGGYPHLLSDSYYPRWVTDGFDDFLEPENVSAPGGLLAASGHWQAQFEDVLATRLPTMEEAATLRMPGTIPLLIHSRVGYDEDGLPVRLEVRRMASDQVEVSYRVQNGRP